MSNLEVVASQQVPVWYVNTEAARLANGIDNKSIAMTIIHLPLDGTKHATSESTTSSLYVVNCR